MRSIWNVYICGHTANQRDVIRNPSLNMMYYSIHDSFQMLSGDIGCKSQTTEKSWQGKCRQWHGTSLSDIFYAHIGLIVNETDACLFHHV